MFCLNEEKQIETSPNVSLAHALLHLGAFWSLSAHLLSVKLILPYFSSLSMVALSVPFPKTQNRKGTESGLILSKKYIETLNELSHVKDYWLICAINARVKWMQHVFESN